VAHPRLQIEINIIISNTILGMIHNLDLICQFFPHFALFALSVRTHHAFILALMGRVAK